MPLARSPAGGLCVLDGRGRLLIGSVSAVFLAFFVQRQGNHAGRRDHGRQELERVTKRVGRISGVGSCPLMSATSMRAISRPKAFMG